MGLRKQADTDEAVVAEKAKRQELMIKQFLRLHRKGFIQCVDGRVLSFEEWVAEKGLDWLNPEQNNKLEFQP